jgi:protocatechuate 3,4-dioxygenase beta subunit
LGATALASSRLFAKELVPTAAMTEGPFYPDKLPLDTDNDLLIINDTITPALGEITHLSGRILGAGGEPIRNAFVEIWQVDNNGTYIHSGDPRRDRNDKNFQGYGRFLTDSTGRYYFRTIKPVPYPGRTPHIHFGISRNGRRILTTQMLINGHPLNETDGVFRSIDNEQARQSVMVDFKPIPDSPIGELAANFDIVLGQTFDESASKAIQGGIGRSPGMDRPRRGFRPPRPGQP